MCLPEAKTNDFSFKEMQITSVKANRSFFVTALDICKSLIVIINACSLFKTKLKSSGKMIF